MSARNYNLHRKLPRIGRLWVVGQQTGSNPKLKDRAGFVLISRLPVSYVLGE
jgi:hypothetical protein